MVQMSPAGKAVIGLVQFPGSNCDMDCVDALRRHFGIEAKLIWHTETSLPKIDGLVLPGGFSYGDYLRSGALASHSPLMKAVKDFVARGGAAIGICNGFQILTESHLLPGVLLKNNSQKFVCHYVHLVPAAGKTVYHKAAAGKKTLRIPIAHGEGRFHVSPDGLKKLQDQGQILFRYGDENGLANDQSNPNGSIDGIAGIVSENGRVMGMMPHPERATDVLMGGSDDGLVVLKAFLASFL